MDNVPKKGEVTINGEHGTIVFKRVLKHSPEHVWEAITNPKDLAQWLMCSDAKIDQRVGGSLYMKSGPAQYEVRGKILAWDPPRLYEYEWNVAPVPEMPAGQNAIFRYELIPHRTNSTLLTVTFQNLTKEVLPGFAPGTHILLDRLEALLDRTPFPEWDFRFKELQSLYEWRV